MEVMLLRAADHETTTKDQHNLLRAFKRSPPMQDRPKWLGLRANCREDCHETRSWVHSLIVSRLTDTTEHDC